MPWTASKDNLPEAVKDKSLELRQLFVKVSNAVLEDTGNETKAIQAGIHAVITEENKKRKLAKSALEAQKQKKLEEEANYKPPAHLSALLEAANIRKQKETLVLQEKEEDRQEIEQSILQQVNEMLKDTVVDMKVQGEDVLLILRSGKRLKRKLADYNIDAKIVTAVQNQVYLEPCSGFNLEGYPEIFFSYEGDVMMLEANHLI